MGNHLILWDVSVAQIQGYYLFVFIAFIASLYRYRDKTFELYIILIFFGGLISFVSPGIFNFYKIVIALLALYWLNRSKSFEINRLNKSVLLSFIFFTFAFLFTAFLNNDSFTIIFSQFSRYFIILAFFLIFMKYRNDNIFKFRLEKIIFDLLLVQIVLSVIKFFVMGTTESIVGSVASQGGASATVLPIIGVIFLWLKRKSLFKKNDWVFILGLIFIGFESQKRAIWFIVPIILALVVFYVPRRRISLKLAFISIIAVPIIFYFGVRLNYTLNKEQKIWGSFDLTYVLEYTQTYSFGDTGFNPTGQGRGGATLMLFENFINGRYSLNEIYGYGLRYMFATDYEQFQQLGFGLHNKGSAAGVFQTMISNGYIGILTFLIFALSILWKTKNKRFRLVLIILFVWEYFFYTGILLRDPILAILLIYFVVFSEANLSREKYYSTNAFNTARKNLETLLPSRSSTLPESNTKR